MQSFFFRLSGSNRARRVLMALPFAKRVSSRFVAGETLDKALDVSCALNEKHLAVCLDLLGESVHSDAEAQAIAADYLKLLEGIAGRGVEGYVSLKLTALGLDIAESLCMAQMRRTLTRARELKRFIRIDMEGSAYTARTLAVFRALRAEGFDNLGIVIQSYLRRSEADMRALAVEGANVRLVKGAYKEPPDLAFPAKADVDANYIKLMQIFLSDEARAAGAWLAVATHDDKMIGAAVQFANDHKLGKDAFEFQMLYGVRGSRLEALAAEGYKARVYIPYGTAWYPYFMRRLAERPANVWFIARNFFRS